MPDISLIINELRERYGELNVRNNEKYFAEFPELQEFCVNLFEKNRHLAEKFEDVCFGVYHGILSPVKCENEDCQNYLGFREAVTHRFCCHKCGCSKSAQDKRVETCLKKYGAATPLSNAYVKKKSEESCQRKFGNNTFAGSKKYREMVDSPFLSKDVQAKARNSKIEKYGENFGKVIFDLNKEKIKSSNFEKFGVEYPLQSKIIQEKSRDAMYERYGSRYFFGTEESALNHKKIKYERILKWKDYVVPLFNEEDYLKYGTEHIYRWRCAKCGTEFESEAFCQKNHYGEELRNVPRCEKCFPHTKPYSTEEKSLVEYIKEIYAGEIIQNSKNIINPYEIDIYLPEKRMAFEFNGSYWHSEEFKGKNYHLNKLNMCNEKGIRLIHVFEDEWNNKQEIVKDRIRSILIGDGRRIFARKCNVKMITSKESNEFLKVNHIQGACSSTYRYGLFYDNELVFVMTFGKPRFDKHHQFELIRLCSKIGTRVIGGASRLLKHFERDVCPKSILSYADKCFSNGDVYEKIGFVKLIDTEPGYFWVKRNERYSRYSCQKSKLRERYGERVAGLSESEIMNFNGFWKVYDCGNFVYSKSFKV